MVYYICKRVYYTLYFVLIFLCSVQVVASDLDKKIFSTNSANSLTKVPPALASLMEHLSMPVEDNIYIAKQEFMNQWGRDPSAERWDIKSKNFSKEVEAKLWIDLKVLGLINALAPSKKRYDYAVIFGGTLPTMLKRFEYLIKLNNQGVTFSNLIILTGQRPIVVAIEWQPNTLSQAKMRLPCNKAMMPATEYEAAVLLYRCLALPEPMNSVYHNIYNIPRKFKALRWERPDTKDTINVWLRDLNKNNSILAVSNQPHIPYQYQVLRSMLSKSYEIEVVGPEISKTTSIEVALDAVAKWLEFYNPKLLENPAVKLKKGS